MPQTVRDSHYVPQATLRRWSVDGTRVHAYRVLVSREEVPAWELRSIKHVAYQRDLYIVASGGKKSDDFEHWVQREYEDPGFEAIEDLLASRQMTAAQWKAIILFAAVQDLRTPLRFLECMERWKQQIPEILDRTLRDGMQRLEDLRSRGEHVYATPDEPGNEARNFIRARVEPEGIRLEVDVGQDLWLAETRRMLTGVAKRLTEHRWSIAEPYGDEEWCLTDHPVVRLNYYRPGHYDFGGGWGNPGSEILMPLSPRHLLYVQVGKKHPNRLRFSKEQTQLVQRFLVERAHRWVFARRPLDWVPTVRPRNVDAALFEEEQRAWREWRPVD